MIDLFAGVSQPHIVRLTHYGFHTQRTEEWRLPDYQAARDWAREAEASASTGLVVAEIIGPQRKQLDPVERTWRRFEAKRSQIGLLLMRTHPDFVLAVSELIHLCDIGEFREWVELNPEELSQSLKFFVSDSRAFRQALEALLVEKPSRRRR